MRIFMEGPVTGQVELVVGGLNLPVSREQALQALFGDPIIVTKKPGRPRKLVAEHYVGRKEPKKTAPVKKSVRAQRAAAGTCSFCGKKRAPGKKVCAKHLKSLRENAKTARSKEA